MDQPEIFNLLKYLGNSNEAESGVGEVVTSRISRVKVVSINVRHPSRRREI